MHKELWSWTMFQSWLICGLELFAWSQMLSFLPSSWVLVKCCSTQELEPSPGHQLVGWDPDHLHNCFVNFFSRPGPSFLRLIFSFFGMDVRVLSCSLFCCIKAKMPGLAWPLQIRSISHSDMLSSKTSLNQPPKTINCFLPSALHHLFFSCK